MQNQKDTLKILNCDKSTLSRYVKNGELQRFKKGRNTFYDEHEVAALVKKIEANKKRVGIEIKPKEKIKLPPKIEQETQVLAANSKLTALGIEILSTATKDLIDMGLYEQCDKQILLCYALSAQAYNHYYVKSLECGVLLSGDTHESEDGTLTVELNRATVHPYHKMMLDHQKMMLNYSDRLGLNPLARTKLETKEKKEKGILDILNEE
ncbi:P27 family phage terminase small subunit [Arcobacter arenosus]|uniref:Terminase n=1 Tax=Arcobacter arenosus TaxID=2576037 RepID=A0A5R8Y4Z4_9BACT|nr:P27 family phage terminase small subunit [Arcobacter arenosus]TLP41048.1 hypothetical protein FDK22_03240 [Arcobacter arenosus]